MKRTSTTLAALVGLVTLSSSLHAQHPPRELTSNYSQNANITITTTIRIRDGVTYNGNGYKITAKGMGDGSQSESQKAFFQVYKSARLQNVVLTAPGVDGIYFEGTGALATGVFWQDVGEDAATIKVSGTHTLTNSSGTSAADKFGQANAACTWRMNAVRQTTSLKIIRQSGSTTFTCNLYYSGVTTTNCKEAIGRTDASSTRFYYKSVTASSFGGKSGWWYGRTSQASTF